LICNEYIWEIDFQTQCFLCDANLIFIMG